MNPECAELGQRLQHDEHPHYTSTYCIHEQHADCRLTCKICDEPCQCGCHTDHLHDWAWVEERGAFVCAVCDGEATAFAAKSDQRRPPEEDTA